MTTLQVVVRNQSIKLYKSFTERCAGSLTLRSWAPDLMAHPGTQLSHREAGLDARSLFGAARKAQVWHGDIPAEKKREAPGSQALLGLHLDDDIVVGQRSQPKSRTLSFHHPPLSNLPDKWKFQSCVVPGREALAKDPGLQRECDPDTGGRSKD